MPGKPSSAQRSWYTVCPPGTHGGCRRVCGNAAALRILSGGEVLCLYGQEVGKGLLLGGPDGACLEAPLREPRVPRGGGTGRTDGRPQFSRGSLPALGKTLLELGLASPTTTKTGVGGQSQHTRLPWGSAEVQPRQQRPPRVLGRIHPSSLLHSAKPLLATPYLPPATGSQASVFRAVKWYHSSHLAPCAGRNGGLVFAVHGMRSRRLSPGPSLASSPKKSDPASYQSGLLPRGSGGAAGRGSEEEGNRGRAR